jgi:3-oxo-4,17-pregnadiene-20-carboxyl-CoA hydratase alpha subunit
MTAPGPARETGAPAASSATDPGTGLAAALAAFEGCSTGGSFTMSDPVNQPMIRHWVEAMGDENPVYVDEIAARAEGFGGVVAPPTMLQAWVMRGYRATAQAEAARGGTGDAGARPGPVAEPSAQEELFALLDAAGFTSVVATDCEQEYTRPLVLGDVLTCESVIESVSPEKHTALGEGHFVTTRTDFTDASGEPVATMRFRILRFRPRAVAPVAPKPLRPRPAITQDNSFFFEGLAAGRLLIQRCASCGVLRHPPRPACAVCRSLEWDTVVASGRGTVFSFVVVHHPQVPAFDYPLPIAVVQLEEGTRLVADLVGVDPADVVIGMPVELEIVAVDDELCLAMFRPVSSAHIGAADSAPTDTVAGQA